MDKIKKPLKLGRDFQKEVLKQMITLSSAGFGVVAALAWNEAIQAFVNEYIVTYLSVGSGIASKFIYAVVITIVAVLVTYQLTRLIREKEDEEKKT